MNTEDNFRLHSKYHENTYIDQANMSCHITMPLHISGELVGSYQNRIVLCPASCIFNSYYQLTLYAFLYILFCCVNNP